MRRYEILGGLFLGERLSRRRHVAATYGLRAKDEGCQVWVNSLWSTCSRPSGSKNRHGPTKAEHIFRDISHTREYRDKLLRSVDNAEKDVNDGVVNHFQGYFG